MDKTITIKEVKNLKKCRYGFALPVKSYQLKCAVWEFTLECNLNCLHCGSAAGTPRPNELNTQECFELCEGLADLGCEEVSLMGGEPFMREDWLPVAQCIKDLGMNLTFVSNGILLPQVITDLVDLNPKVVGISLDGMKENHNYIRGDGTFQKAIEAIKLLRKHEIQTTVITTISKINFKDVLKLKDLLLKKGINWQIQVATPFGNFTKDRMLSKEDFYATALWIAKERIQRPFNDLPLIGAHDFGYYSNILPTSEWDGCPAGKTSIGITSNGGIVGCLAMGNERFIEGNVREQSITSIWADPENFSYNRNFTKADLGPNCKDCRYALKCKGGCNSMSYALTKQFHNDPYCFHRIEKKNNR